MLKNRHLTRLGRAVVALVAAGALFGGGMAAATHVFSDTPPWIHDEAAWLAQYDIAGGYPDGTFRPSSNVTRGQAALWFQNYAAATYLRVNQFSGTQSSVSATVTCESDERALAGGGDINDLDFSMVSSMFSGAFQQSYTVTWNGPDGSPYPVAGEVWALCGPRPLGQG